MARILRAFGAPAGPCPPAGISILPRSDDPGTVEKELASFQVKRCIAQLSKKKILMDARPKPRMTVQ
ncbi:MAG: hypothetical protein EAY70_05525 [Sphingomonadales bacterium]|nr:MAG: hypothetical protein EAY70_05525 [Sphingomonadales bacterium]